MVSTATARASSPSGFSYIQQDGQAQELCRSQLVGETPEELNHEFNMYSAGHDNLKKNQINIILSPDAEQRNFTKEEFKELTEKHLKNLKLDNNPYIAVLHTNTKNPHIHILVSRVNQEGQTYKDNFISKKAQESGRKLAQEYGLKNPIEKKVEIKKQIHKAIVKEVENSYSMAELTERLKNNQAIKLETVYKRNSNEIQGYNVFFKGEKYKLSEINRGLGKGIKIQIGNNQNLQNRALQFLKYEGHKLPIDLQKLAINYLKNGMPLPISIAFKITDIAKNLLNLSKGLDRGMGY